MADKEELLSGINFISRETLDGISETDDSKLYLMEKTVLDNGDTLDFQVQYPLSLDTTSNPNVVNAVYNNTDCLGIYNYNDRSNARSVSTPYTVTIYQGSFSMGDTATWELSSYVDIPFNYKTDVFYAQKGLHTAALGYMNGENKFVPLFFIVGNSTGSTVCNIVHVSSLKSRNSTTMDVEALGSNSNYSSTFLSSSFSYYQFYSDGDSIYARSEDGNDVEYKTLSSSALADLEKVTTVRIAGIQAHPSQPIYTEQGVFRWPYNRIICETEWQTPEGLGLTRVYPPKFTPATVLSCVQDYNNLENLPRLNGIPLVGDVSFDSVDLQKNLTTNLPLIKSGILHDTYVGFTVEGNMGSSAAASNYTTGFYITGVTRIDDNTVMPTRNCVILPYSPNQTVYGAFEQTNIYFGKLLDNGSFRPLVALCNHTSNTNSAFLGGVSSVNSTVTNEPQYISLNYPTGAATSTGYRYTNAIQLRNLTSNATTVYYNDTRNGIDYLKYNLGNMGYDEYHNLLDINAVLIVPNYTSFSNWQMDKVGVYSISGSYGVDFGEDAFTPENKVAGIDTENSVQYLDVKIDNQTIQVNANGELSANLDEIGSDIVDINSALGGFAFKSMTQSEYAALATKDPTTLYVTTGSTPGLYFGSVVIVQGAA